MGTSYHVTVIADSERLPAGIAQEIQAVLDDIDGKMSTYKPESELSRLNAAPLTQDFPVSAPLMEVLALSANIYRDTGGAFDPTVGALVDLWGFGPSFRDDQLPNETDINALLKKIGFDGLELQPQALVVRKTKDISLDLSAVAKGYAADKVAELLAAHGLSRYMVEVGGEMVLSGLNARNVPWQIAVEQPVSHTREVQRVISLSDVGVATSGGYRNYFERNGQRYSHTLDPRTGYPIAHKLASVTVIADSSARADALATAFLVMGSEATLNYANTYGIAALTLSKEGEGFTEKYSDAFKAYLKEVN